MSCCCEEHNVNKRLEDRVIYLEQRVDVAEATIEELQDLLANATERIKILENGPERTEVPWTIPDYELRSTTSAQEDTPEEEEN